MKTKIKTAIILITLFRVTMLYAQTQETSASVNNDEVEASPLMMFGYDKKFEEKKENLSTADQTAQHRRDAEVVEREQEPIAITVGDYCKFLNAIAADDSNGLYDEKMGVDNRLEAEDWRLEGQDENKTVCDLVIRFGKSGSYHYEAVKGKENFVITYLSELNVTRYRDWLDNRNDVILSSSSCAQSLKPNDIYYGLLSYSSIKALTNKNSGEGFEKTRITANEKVANKKRKILGGGPKPDPTKKSPGKIINEEKSLSAEEAVAIEKQFQDAIMAYHDAPRLIVKDCVIAPPDPNSVSNNKDQENQTIMRLLKNVITVRYSLDVANGINELNQLAFVSAKDLSAAKISEIFNKLEQASNKSLKITCLCS